MDAFNIIKAHGVIPVLSLNDPATAPKVAAALCKGGLPLLEITMRTERAMLCLKAIKSENPDILVGAGTILRCEQVDEAKQAGADFIVAPGFNVKVVTHCQELGLPVVSGCVTPTEIEAGMALGLSTFKFFPAEALGGMKNISQLCGPYNNIQFIPTAGINLSNMEQYLCNEKIAAVGGSFMAPASMVDAQDWEGITTLCQKAVEKSLGFSLAYIGINTESKQEGRNTARWFAERFGFPVKEGDHSNFTASYVECCNQKFPGTLGYIGIFTLSPTRAMAYFQSRGIPLREAFKHVDAKGNLESIYLEEEISGFAVHVVKNGSVK